MAERSNPYSQHFRCMPRLLQNSVRNDIFMFLLDEHLQQLHQKQGTPVIAISNREIGEKAGVNRNIVPSHLEELQRLNLISLQKRFCTINVNFLINIVSLFNEQTNADGYQKVRSAFLAGDIERLEELGLKKSKNGNRELLALGGTIENAQMCATLPICVPSGTDVCQDANMCATLPIFKQLGTHIGSLKEAFDTPDELFEAISRDFSSPNAQMCAKKFANMVFDAQMCATDELKSEALEMIVQLFTEMTILGGLNIGIFGMPICVPSGTDLSHRNKYIKENKKEIIQSEALAKEKTKEVEDENDEEDEEFFSGFGKPLEVVELKQFETVKELSEPSSKRRALSYPMFTVEEVDRIVSNLDYAATSPLKLFINTVWWILSDYVQESIELDEDDEELPEIINIEGHGFPIEDFQKEILEVAYEEVEGYMDKGCIETEDGQSISVSFTEMFPFELLGSIFKWEKKALSHDESVYEISKNGIYDVSAEKIERACQPETREEKRAAIQDSLQYMTKLYLIQNSKLPELDRLTPIEKIAAKCIAAYLVPEETDSGTLRFSINKDSESISEEGSIIKNSWRTLKATIKKHGYTEQEFLSCLLNSKAPSQYEQLTIQPCMFFADGIRTLNKLHGHESVIDDLSIDDLK